MAETHDWSLDSLATRALPVLRERFGPQAALGGAELVKDTTRTVVARLAVTGAPVESLVLKAIRDDPATGFTEWASLAFLSAVPGARGLAPAFLGGSVGGRLLLLEDLGAGRTLHDVLSADSRAEAEGALVELARQTALLAGITAGREADLLGVRQALPAAEGHGRARESERWLAARPRLVAWLDAAGLDAPAGFDAALEHVAAGFAAPGPWLAFTHGDPAPSNNHVAGGRVRLLDFEYGAFRHALYDITAWDTLCPLPPPQVAAMRRAFRQELARHLLPAADPHAFDAAWALLCAYRALAILTWVSPAALAADQPWVGEWTARRAALAALTRLEAVAEPHPALAPLVAFASRLRGALRPRWPEIPAGDVATSWPALAASER